MLNGIKVVDISRVLAGPLCTMMLADLGANVIKVERPESGDDTRGWGPPFADDGQSAYFRSVNRNKLSIALALDEPTDADLLRALIAGADVVVDNYLPGALARKGIDTAGLLAAHPRLIWCTISGFGAESTRPGYDFVVQAECGWMSITGPVDGEPHKVGVALADVIAGKDAAIAILAALIGRSSRSASERQLHITLRDSATAALVNVAQNALLTGADAARWGNAHPNLVPYQLFAAADRHLVIAVGNDGQWLSCARVVGLDVHPRAVQWRTNEGRVRDREQLVPEMTRHLRTQSASHWLRELGAVGVPCGVVRSVHEALADVASSEVSGVASAVGGRLRLAPPALNAHGPEIRRRGWDAFSVTMSAD